MNEISQKKYKSDEGKIITLIIYNKRSLKMGSPHSSTFQTQIHNENLWNSVLGEKSEQKQRLLQHLKMLDEKRVECFTPFSKNKLFSLKQTPNQGLIYDEDKMMYFGDIIRGAPEGIGVLYQNGKLIYKGQVKNGRRHGNGVLYKNEQKLVVDSEWQEDKLQKLTLEDGKQVKILGKKNDRCWRVSWKTSKGLYEGDIIYQDEVLVKHGSGKWTGNDGYYYEGEWERNQQEGSGTSLYQNKDRYQGYFKEGKKNGRGSYTFSDGRKVQGFWENDVLKSGKQYSVKGQIILEYPANLQP